MSDQMNSARWGNAPVVRSYYGDVAAFHEKFGLPRRGDGGTPHLLEDDVREFRDKFMQEELDEFRDACEDGDLAAAADALADLVYVALGTAHLMRLPFDEVWAEVQRANMTKERRDSTEVDPRSKRGHHLDVVKPDGWRPPDVASILVRAGA